MHVTKSETPLPFVVIYNTWTVLYIAYHRCNLINSALQSQVMKSNKHGSDETGLNYNESNVNLSVSVELFAEVVLMCS